MVCKLPKGSEDMAFRVLSPKATLGGRYWIRTSDFYRVKVALFR